MKYYHLKPNQHAVKKKEFLVSMTQDDDKRDRALATQCGYDDESKKLSDHVAFLEQYDCATYTEISKEEFERNENNLRVWEI